MKPTSWSPTSWSHHHEADTMKLTPWSRRICPSLWPSGISMHLGRNRLWVQFLAVSDIYPMFIQPTITWVPSGFSGYIWLDTKIVLKKKKTENYKIFNELGNVKPGYFNQPRNVEGYFNQQRNGEGYFNQPRNVQGYFNQQRNGEGYFNQPRNVEGYFNQQRNGEGYFNQPRNGEGYFNQQRNGEGYFNQSGGISISRGMSRGIPISKGMPRGICQMLK